MDKIIQIEVDISGQAKIEGIGFKGSGCKDATAAHEKMYDDPISHEVKPEMYEGASCSAPEIKIGG
jgi:hypothetical protein